MARKRNAPASEIANRYRDGETLRQIGEAYGIGTSQVHRIVVRAGVQRGPLSKIRVEASEEMVRRYLNGETSTAIAKSFGMSPTTVLTRLRNSGVEIRRAGSQPLVETHIVKRRNIGGPLSEREVLRLRREVGLI